MKNVIRYTAIILTALTWFCQAGQAQVFEKEAFVAKYKSAMEKDILTALDRNELVKNSSATQAKAPRKVVKRAASTIIATQQKNPILIKVARREGWISSTATTITQGDADKVTEIPDDCFMDETSLTSLDELQYFTNLEVIGVRAFIGCSNMSSIILPEGLITIKALAFSDSGIKTIHLPSTINEIGAGVFADCLNLSAITSDAEWLTVINGALLVNSVKIIAFPANSSYTSFSVPSGVTTIRYYAFSSCKKLKTIYFNSSLTDIEDHAFDSCENLIISSLPNSLQSLGDYAFQGCDAIKTINIGTGVYSIGDSPFNNCSSLTSITVDSSNNYFASDNGVLFTKSKTTLIQYPVARNATSYVVPSTVTKIGERAICAITNLKDLTLPASLNSLGDVAVGFCPNITTIKALMPSPPKMDYYCFYPSYETATLYVPAGRRSVYQSTDYWSSFTNIVEEVSLDISCTPTAVSFEAGGGTQYVRLTSTASWTATADKSWITVTQSGNAGTNMYLAIKASSNTSTESRSGKVTFTAKDGGNTKSVTVTVTQKGVEKPALNITCNPTSINAEANGGYQSVSVTSTADWTATSDKSWITVTQSGSAGENVPVIITVSVNTGTESRSGKVTFTAKDGSNTKTATVTVTQKGVDTPTLDISCYPTTFSVEYNGGNLTVYLTSTASWTATADNSWISVVRNGSAGNNIPISITIGNNTSTNSREGRVIFTASSGGNTKSVGVTITQKGKVDTGDLIATKKDGDPKENKPLIEAAIGIGWVGNGAEELRVSDIRNVTSITSEKEGKWFGKCNVKSLDELQYFPNLKEIDDEAFKSCTVLERITLPKVTSIGNGIFTKCSNLSSISMIGGGRYGSPINSNAIIDYNDPLGRKQYKLLAGCKNTVIPQEVVIIASYAFNECASLTSIEFPEGVKEIESNAFYLCSALGAVTFPTTTEKIGNTSFGGCDNIKTVVANMETPCTLSESAFSSKTFSSATLYVPKGKKSAYKVAENWKRFYNVVELSVPNPVSITCNSTGLKEFEAEGGTQQVKITTNADWSVSGVPSWLTVTPNNGGAGTDIAVTIKANSNIKSNTSTDPREASITFIAKNGSDVKQATLIIKQKGKEVVLDPVSITCNAGELKEFEATGGTQQIKISTNASWKASGLPGWITVTPSSGGAGTDISVAITVNSNINANASTEAREATITFTATRDNESKTATLTIKQKGKKVDAPYISVAPDQFVDIPAEGESYALMVSSNVNWTAEPSYKDDTWIAVGPNSGHAGGTMVIISIIANPNTSERSGYVYFNAVDDKGNTIKDANGKDVTATLLIKQKGKEVEPEPVAITCSVEELPEFEATGGTQQVKITSNADWIVYEIPEWITVAPDNGNAGTDVPVTIQVNPNTSTEPREATIIFTATKGEETKTITLTIKQKGKEVEPQPEHVSITYNSEGLQAFDADGGIQQVKITSNAEWFVSGLPEWITVTPNNGNAGTDVLVTIQANPNTATEQRVATITFIATNDGEMATVALTIKQKGKDVEPEPEPASITCNAEELPAFEADGGRQQVKITSNADWSVSGVPSWITVTPSSGTAGTDILVTIQGAPNTSTDPREATITFTAIKEGKTEKVTLTIKQKGKEVEPEHVYITCDAKELPEFKADGGQQQVKVSSNADWSVSGVPSWIMVTPGSGTAGTDILVTIQVNPNTSTAPREATITFTAIKDGKTATVTLTIKQPGKEPEPDVTVDVEQGDIAYTLNIPQKEAVITKVKSEFADVVIPSSISYQGTAFTVTTIGDAVLSNANTSVSFPSTITSISNIAFVGCATPTIILQSNKIKLTEEQVTQLMGYSRNSLLYVPSSNVLPVSVANNNNIVINGVAKNIVLVDAHHFHCPQEFLASKISYSHNYGMKTGKGSSAGWETIALPFEVQTITHETKGNLVPFAKFKSNSTDKPFWLYKLSTSGFVKADKIEAVVPYLICMPNNSQYASEYNVDGVVYFTATNARVKTTKDDDNAGIKGTTYKGKEFRPTFWGWTANPYFHCINAVNSFASTTGRSSSGESLEPGSAFLAPAYMRKVYPFEGYFYYEDTADSRECLPIIFAPDGDTTGLEDASILISSDNSNRQQGIFTLQGQRVQPRDGESVEELLHRLPTGVYLVNGKKVFVNHKTNNSTSINNLNN